MDDQEFRQRTLTLLGAVGYLVALALMVVDIMPEFSVPLRTIFIVLLTSSALLGVDYGIDVFNLLSHETDRPHKPDSDRPVDNPDGVADDRDNNK